MDGMRMRISGHWKLSLRTFLIFSVWSYMSVCGAYAQTFNLTDGDVVDCIPIENQPSLKDLANPTYNKYPKTMINPGSDTSFPILYASIANQTFALEGGACPDGTIPVLQNDQIVGDSTTLRRQKYRKSAENPETSTEPLHEYAIATANASTQMYKGTEVIMTVYNPVVENRTEFSLAQLWITKGSYRDGNLNTVEAGYQVYPDLREGFDNHSRLFVYWTADNYTDTGCYDLGCPGFIQVSNKVLLRGSFLHTSEVGKIYEIKLRVFQENDTSDWWLFLNDEVVGYWPSSIFTEEGLQGSADSVQWGGEIVDDEEDDGNRHTETDMGSGKYANVGDAGAAYMRKLQYVDSEYNLVDSPFELFNTSAPCYSVQTMHMDPTYDIGYGSYFYFGGPGYNPQCLTDPGLDL